MTAAVLYYALGGGLGHLVRAGRFLRQQGLAQGALILSTAASAADPRLSAGVSTLPVPAALQHDVPALRDWLSARIVESAPRLVCVDCFPAGLLGELSALPALRDHECWLVARRLRWSAYAPLLAATPRYARAWRLEPLEAAHEDWLSGNADSVLPLQLAVPEPLPRVEAEDDPEWLVVHSGPEAEVQELLDYACTMRRLEAAPVRIGVASLAPPARLPEGCVAVDPWTVRARYPAVRRLIGAAGFNFVTETEPWCGKRRLLPFPRRYDDQFARAARVAATAAVTVAA